MPEEPIVTYRGEKVLKCVIFLLGEQAALWNLSADDKAFISQCIGKELPS